MALSTRSEMVQTLLDFVDAFNRNDLDTAMRYFAEDAVYQTFDGERHVGRAAIRAAFDPQFRLRYGALRFKNEDLIVDERQQRAVLRWVCEHDLTKASSPWRLLRVAYGDRPAWQGLDVFYMDGGLIREKHTFARARVPRLFRTLAPEPWRGATTPRSPEPPAASPAP